MDYTSWQTENLAAEKRSLEAKNTELEREVEFLTRRAQAAFDERDRRIVGKSQYDQQGKRYQDQRDEVWKRLGKNNNLIRLISEELGLR